MAVDITTVFSRNPGDVIYFVLVLALTGASLLMVVSRRNALRSDRMYRRYALALTGVVFAWGLMMAVAVFVLLSGSPPDAFLPPLERAVLLLIIVSIGWAFLQAEQAGTLPDSRIVPIGLVLLILSGYAFTALEWRNVYVVQDFNISAYAVPWLFSALILNVLGLILTMVWFRRIVDAPLKFLFFFTLSISIAYALYQTVQGDLIGDYSGVVRLGLVIALATVPVIVFRLILFRMQIAFETLRQSIIQQTPASVSAPPVETRAQAGDPQSVQLLKSLGIILEAGKPNLIPEQIVYAALEVLRADVGALLHIQNANYLQVFHAYDRVMKRRLFPMSINLENQPTLFSVIERRTQRAIFPDRNPEEANDLFTRLDVEQMGPVYFQPLTRDAEVIGILLIALPYSERELQMAEIELLRGFGILAGNLLHISQVGAKSDSAELEGEILPADKVSEREPETVTGIASVETDLSGDLQLAREQIAELSRQVMTLKLQLDDERTRFTTALEDTETGQGMSEQINGINQTQEQLRAERDQLARSLQEAETALYGATAESEPALMQNMVASLEQERDELIAERKRLQAELTQLQLQAQDSGNIQNLIDGMTAENSRLEKERAQLKDKLTHIQAQLSELGFQGGLTGLSNLLAQLYDGRQRLQARVDKLQQERDSLLNERRVLSTSMDQEQERSRLIETLQQEVQNLANDREALTKQRDRYQFQLTEMISSIDRVKEHRARLLAQLSGLEIELKEAHDEQTRLRAQIQELANARSGVVGERDRLLAQKRTLEVERDQLSAQLGDDASNVNSGQQDAINALQKMVDDLTSERERLDRELAATQEQLQEATLRIAMLEQKNEEAALVANDHDNQLMMGLVQELRSPLTSILGYVELLLGESAGILGERQRSFLRRVMTNTARMNRMLDDLITIAQLDAGQYHFQISRFDVVRVVEQVLSEAAILFREKGLVVNLAIDNQGQYVNADLDTLKRILGQLVTNAYHVTPPQAEISVSVGIDIINQNGSTSDVVKVIVEDQGGGIYPADLDEVFRRRYHAENALIQGLGDTGVGMSIAKALIEAQGGSIQVSTEPGQGSRFVAILPTAAPVESGIK